MKFRSISNPPNTRFDKTGGDLITERAGYRSASQQIQAMLMSGQKLVQARSEMYNTDDEINDDNFVNGVETPDGEVLKINPMLATVISREKRKTVSDALLKKAAQKNPPSAESQAPEAPNSTPAE